MLKSLTFILLISGLFTFNNYAQVWPKVYGDDIHAYGTGIIETYDNGYIIVGGILDGQFPVYAWLIKTDINGETLWDKVMGDGSYIVNYLDVDVTDEGGIILSGATTLYDNYSDPFIIKFNACGEKEWCRIFHTANDPDYGDRVIPLPDGGYLALISYWDYDLLNKRIWLFKLDEDGEIIWQKVYAQNDPKVFSEEGYEVLITSDTNYLITGLCYYPDPGVDSVGWNRPYLILTDEDGEEIWELPWGINDYFYGDSFSSSEGVDGNFYIAGRHNRIDPPGDSPCLFIANKNGQALYYKDIFPETDLGIATTINVWDDSTLAIGIAYIENNNEFVSVIKTDLRGNITNEKVLLNADNTLRGSDVTFDYKLVMVGGFYVDGNVDIYAFKFNSVLEYDTLYTQPFVYDSLCPYPIVSDTIPLDTLSVGVEMIEPDKLSTLTIIPNPATDHIKVVLPDHISTQSQNALFNVTTWKYRYKGDVPLEIYDLFGRRWLSYIIPEGDKEAEIDVSVLPAGIYLIRAVIEGQVVSGKAVIE